VLGVRLSRPRSFEIAIERAASVRIRDLASRECQESRFSNPRLLGIAIKKAASVWNLLLHAAGV
jgi:hypothetical protein